MDLVPLKKRNLRRAQFEQLSDVSPEDECIRDLGHIRSIQMCPPNTYVYESAKRSDGVDQREHHLSSGS
jgi:hypothetical protein